MQLYVAQITLARIFVMFHCRHTPLTLRQAQEDSEGGYEIKASNLSKNGCASSPSVREQTDLISICAVRMT